MAQNNSLYQSITVNFELIADDNREKLIATVSQLSLSKKTCKRY